MSSTEALPTLAELATTLPGASRVFQRHRLDFCCQGRRTLAEACRAAGLDAAAIRAEIEREGRPAQVAWNELPVGQAVDEIERTYHASHRRELPALVELATKVERVHGERAECPRGLAEHLRALHDELEQHMLKEERVLFPLIREGLGFQCAAPIRVMEQEHEDAAGALRRTRALTGDLVAPACACTTWRALYARLEVFERELMEHAGLENNVLFPRALAGGR